jgi:GTP-binding protein LepA
VYLALENDLEIVVALNKIDLPSADLDSAARQVEEVVGLDATAAIPSSGKTGEGVRAILEAVVARVPAPEGDPNGTLRALVFDCWYDSYRGAVVMVRVVDGQLRKGQKVRLMAAGRDYDVTEIGVFDPHLRPLDELSSGEVGFFAASIKSVHETKIGDTVTDARKPAREALPGFREVKPMVFAGVFPTDSAEYETLREALQKLNMNDAAFVFEPDTSEALGFGFRCGFLGLLHMDIIQERLEREYDLDLVTTAPSVAYEVHLRDGECVRVENPARMPDVGQIERVEEPIYRVTIHLPATALGSVLKLCQERRGVQKGLQYTSGDHVVLTYELPLAEVLFDFHDRLKSVSRGYASMDYELVGYRPADLVKLDLLVNGEPLDALSVIVHREQAQTRGRALAVKLKELVPRQQYEVAIQAALGSKVIARTTVKALRKDVTAKCYGGDITRKRKLLEKQREGKRRMKKVGKVEIPQEAFLAILKVDE